MRVKQLITASVAVLVLIGGAAAVGAASPADQAPDSATGQFDEHTPDDDADRADDNDSHADDGNASAADDAGPDRQNASASGPVEAAGNATAGPSDAAANTTLGPSDGLPEQVPDHVSEIHQTVEMFLDDPTGSLGELLSDLLTDDTGVENATAA